MAVNRELNKRVADLYHQLLSEHKVRNKKDFCVMIDWEEPSFSHVLNNKRSFPKGKIPVLVTKFNLPRDYFNVVIYSTDDICEKIKHIRKLKEMTQREFADALGVTQAAISSIENKSNREPSFPIIWGLINKMKVNPYFIFSDDQVVFDNQKKFSNRAKIDQTIKNLKSAMENLNQVSL
jgi:transcriptional regulator with XRE-family HTH domain